MNIITIISDLWKDDKLPVINGMLKRDGSFYELRENKLYFSDSHDINSRDYDNQFSYIDATVSLNDSGISYHCGCGSHGSDGWVLALSNENEVEWLFFDYVNPFEKLWIKDGAVHALNNLNVEWIFPITKPEDAYMMYEGSTD